MANTHSADFELDSEQSAGITDALQTGLDILGDISLECWIKLEQLPGTAGTNFALNAKADIALADGAWLWQILQGTQRLQFLYQDGLGGFANIQTANDYFDGGDIGVWRQVAVVCDVSTTDALFYKDGVESASDANSGSATIIRNSGQPFTVATIGAGINWFDGKIDEVRVWDDKRSEAEIQNNRLKELVGDEANLQGYWKLNNDWTDKTANGNDLTPVNSPTFSADVPFTDIPAAKIKDTTFPPFF